KAKLVKVKKVYPIYKQLIAYYGATQLIQLIEESKSYTLADIRKKLPAKFNRDKWLNVGGQLMQESTINSLRSKIHSGKIKSWDEVHDFYKQ
ncbi:hypothetical protein ABTM81_19220, partial [Acinetobacter baumannii]